LRRNQQNKLSVFLFGGENNKKDFQFSSSGNKAAKIIFNLPDLYLKQQN
jgi:hypothetical protein